MKEKENETGTTGWEVLRLSLGQILFLVEETRKVFPIESCGFLFGEFTEEEIVVKKIVPVPNIVPTIFEPDLKDSNFEIDGGTVGAALEESEPKLRGFFHSHPAPAVPSSKDIKYMKPWGEDYVWVILSTLKYGGIGAYRIRNGQPERVTIYFYKEKEPYPY